MLGARSSPSLTLENLPEVLFTAQNAPSGAVTLRGTVTLHLGKLVKVSAILIELLGESTLRPPSGRPRTIQHLHRSCTLPLGEELLAPGDRSIRFALEVPIETAPSFQAPFGSISYTLRASLDGWSSWSYTRAERKIEVVATHLADALPPPREQIIQHIEDGLGVFVVGMASPNLCVGGCLFPYINTGCIREAGGHTDGTSILLRQEIQMTVDERVFKADVAEWHLLDLLDWDTPNVSVKPRLDTGLPLCPPEEHQLSIVSDPHNGGKRRWRVRNTRNPELTHWLRIPGHTELKASTMPSLQTPIRVFHTLIFAANYRDRQRRAKVVKGEMPVHLASCACIVENLRLPAYEPIPGQPHLRPGVRCCCSESFDELFEEHKLVMREARRRFDAMTTVDAQEPDRPRKP